MITNLDLSVTEELEFYAVRNKKGKWFRRKGYSGYGETWVDELSKARIYNKIGHARSQVTFFAENYPSYGIPDIVVFKVIESHVINEKERLKKKREKAEKRSEIRRIKMAREKLEEAQREYNEAVL